MKLNLDLIRTVLLCLEENLEIKDQGVLEKSSMTLHDICNLLPGYERKDIFYTLFNLSQAGYIELKTNWTGTKLYRCEVMHITYKGHEFLDKIRDKERWSNVKTVVDCIHDYSLSAISAIAEGVTSAAISKYFSGL